MKRRATIEEELREALAPGTELKVYYQPQVAAAGQPVIGLEALVRWQHPSRGLIARTSSSRSRRKPASSSSWATWSCDVPAPSPCVGPTCSSP